MQAIGRGFLGRKRVKHLRQLAFQKTLFVAVKLQSFYRGWKSRLRVKVLRKLRTTSKAAQRLFQVLPSWSASGLSAYLCIPVDMQSDSE